MSASPRRGRSRAPFWRGARASLVFLTRIPVGGFPYSRDEWRWAPAWFPFAGAVIGALTAAVYALSSGAGALVAAAVAVAASMMITGAFHEDGLADTADALGGAYDRPGVLRILKDSRIGAFGAAALLVSILIRTLALAQLGGLAVTALVVVHCVARVPPIWQMRLMPYVTDDAVSRSKNVARAKTPQALWATALGAAMFAGAWLTGALGAAQLGAVAGALLVVAAISAWRYHRRVGGITGDFLGATEQLGECAGLVALCAVAA